MAAPVQTKLNWDDISFGIPIACYNNLERAAVPEWSSGLACSQNYYAFCGTLNTMNILTTDIVNGSIEVQRAGRAAGYGAMTYNVGEFCTLSSGGAEFTDMVFDPFGHNTLYTSHANGVLKIWELPETMTENITECTAHVEGLGSTINSITLNRAVAGLVGINSAGMLALVNTMDQSVIAHWDLDDQNENLLSSSWNYDNSLLRSVNDKKNLYTVDIRAANLVDNARLRFNLHGLLHLDESDTFMVWGQDSMGRTKFEVYDPRNTAKPTVRKTVPKFNGKALASYDFESKLMYFACRSSKGVACYDCRPMLEGKEWTKLLQENLEERNIGLCMLPRVMIGARETNRLAVLTQNQIVPLETHLRKAVFENKRQLEPVLDIGDWLSGQNSPANKCADIIVTVETTKKSSLKSKFLNINYDEPALLKHDQQFQKMQMDRKSVTGGYNLRMNQRYVVYPAQSLATVAIGVAPLNSPGIRLDSSKRIRGHRSALTSFDISPFEQDLVATAAGDGQVCLWHIPEDFTSDLKTPAFTLQHSEKVSMVRFHPLVPGILVTCDGNSNGVEHNIRVRVFDLETHEVVFQTIIETEASHIKVCDLDFDLTGTRVAIACTDKQVRVIRLRDEAVECEFEPQESRRECQVRWLDDERLVTFGFRAGSKRGFSVWNINTMTSLLDHELDVENAIPLVHVDTNQNLIYWTGHGQRRIRSFEVFENEIFVHKTSHVCNCDNFGWCFKPKQFVNVPEVELNMCWRTDRSRLIPLSFKVMRKRKDFFQDDIYKKTFPIDPPVVSGQDWLGGADIGPANQISLQPENMTLLSMAPKEELTSRQRNRISTQRNMKKTKLEDKKAEDVEALLLDNALRINETNAAPNIGQWTVQAIESEVAEDEWSDS